MVRGGSTDLLGGKGFRVEVIAEHSLLPLQLLLRLTLSLLIESTEEEKMRRTEKGERRR
jgi:hypothetical protein